MKKPHTGLDDCLIMLLPCFTKSMADAGPEAMEDGRRTTSDAMACMGGGKLFQSEHCYCDATYLLDDREKLVLGSCLARWMQNPTQATEATYNGSPYRI